MLYITAHNKNLKQMLASTETSLQRAKRQDVTYVRAARCRRTFPLPLLLAKDWYSARQASILLILIHPLSRSPSSSKLSRRSRAFSSPPMTIAGQKQLFPRPILDRAVTVEITEFVTSCRYCRAFRWNPFFKY